MLSTQRQAIDAIRLENLATAKRRTVVTTTVPLARGQFRPESFAPVFRGRAVQWQPQGPLWPDGSLRVVRAHIAAELAAGASVVEELEVGAAPSSGFVVGNEVLRLLGSGEFRVGLACGSNVVAFGATGWTPVEAGPNLIAYESTVRVPGTPLWAELTVSFLSGCDHADFLLWYGDSDPSDPNVTHRLPPVDLITNGVHTVIRHQSGKEFGRTVNGSMLTINIEPGSKWADGESQMIAGTFVFGGDAQTASAESQVPVLAVAQGWPVSGCFGAWGYVPPSEGNEPSAVAAYNSFGAGGDAWEDCGLFGLLPDAPAPGDQKDFSSAVLTDIARGDPRRIHAAQRGVHNDAHRPTHLRDLEGRPLAISADPSILLWNGRNDLRITGNTLGKSASLGSNETHRAERVGRSWWGRDRQHWSDNYPTTLALLTGDRGALKLCQHHVELWLGEMQVASTSPVLNGMGASRGHRTLHAGVQLWLVTGRTDLFQRIEQRVAVSARDWAGRFTSPTRPIATKGPYPGNLNGLVDFWTPWEDGLAVPCLDACVQQGMNATQAKTIRDAAAANLARYGVWREGDPSYGSGFVSGSNRLTAGKAVRWFDGGRAVDPSRYAQDREAYRPYLLWCGAAMVIAEREGIEVATAQQVVAQLELDRSFRRAEWLAVR